MSTSFAMGDVKVCYMRLRHDFAQGHHCSFRTRRQFKRVFVLLHTSRSIIANPLPPLINIDVISVYVSDYVNNHCLNSKDKDKLWLPANMLQYQHLHLQVTAYKQ